MDQGWGHLLRATGQPWGGERGIRVLEVLKSAQLSSPPSPLQFLSGAQCGGGRLSLGSEGRPWWGCHGCGPDPLGSEGLISLMMPRELLTGGSRLPLGGTFPLARVVHSQRLTVRWRSIKKGLATLPRCGATRKGHPSSRGRRGVG